MSQNRCIISLFRLAETSFGKSSAEEEKDESGNQKNLIALAEARLLLVLLHEGDLAEKASVDGAEGGFGGTGRRQRHVASARGLRDGLESLAVELLHAFSVRSRDG